jgi:hypothetical protein
MPGRGAPLGEAAAREGGPNPAWPDAAPAVFHPIRRRESVPLRDELVAEDASEDEHADVLLAITLVTGLGRVVIAAPHVAIAPGYDMAARLEGTNGY